MLLIGAGFGFYSRPSVGLCCHWYLLVYLFFLDGELMTEEEQKRRFRLKDFEILGERFSVDEKGKDRINMLFYKAFILGFIGGVALEVFLNLLKPFFHLN